MPVKKKWGFSKEPDPFILGPCIVIGGVGIVIVLSLFARLVKEIVLCLL